MKYAYYNKVDKSNPQIPSIDIERELVLFPVIVTLHNAWECWIFSVYLFFCGFCLMSSDTLESHKIRFFKYGISFRVRGFELDVGFHFLNYLTWKTKRMINKNPELKQTLRRIVE